MTIYLEFELVDVSPKLPQLERRPGLTTWRPTADRSAAITFSTYEEFMSSSLDDVSKAKMSEGHWPPKDIGILNLPRWYVVYFRYDSKTSISDRYLQYANLSTSSRFGWIFCCCSRKNQRSWP